MASCPRVFVALSKAEVYDVDDVLLAAEPDQEVVRLDIPVQEAALVDEFDTLQHLNSNH